MTDRVTHDLFKVWSEAQQRLWESLSLPPAHPPEHLEHWRDLYLKQLTGWEATVKQALAAKTAWVEQWARQAGAEPGAPAIVAEWTRRMEAMLEQWIVAQNRLWEDYFKLLKQGDMALGQAPEETPAALPAPAEPAAPPVKDDLQALSGIGPVIEKKLNAYGIVSYRQLALLTDAEIERIETTVIKFPGRIRRDHWIEQAKAQHLQKYHEAL